MPRLGHGALRTGLFVEARNVYSVLATGEA